MPFFQKLGIWKKEEKKNDTLLEVHHEPLKWNLKSCFWKCVMSLMPLLWKRDMWFHSKRETEAERERERDLPLLKVGLLLHSILFKVRHQRFQKPISHFLKWVIRQNTHFWKWGNRNCEKMNVPFLKVGDSQYALLLKGREQKYLKNHYHSQLKVRHQRSRRKNDKSTAVNLSKVPVIFQ